MLLFEPGQETWSSIQPLLGSLGIEALTVTTADRARQELQREAFDILILDIDMPGGSDLLEEADGDLDVIIVTEQASVHSAVEALRGGAMDYLTKPLDLQRLRKILEGIRKTRTLQHRISEMSRELRSLGRFDQMVGQSAAMQDV